MNTVYQWMTTLLVVGLLSTLGDALKCYQCHYAKLTMQNPLIQAATDAEVAKMYDGSFDIGCNADTPDSKYLLTCEAPKGKVATCTKINVTFDGNWGGAVGDGFYMGRGCEKYDANYEPGCLNNQKSGYPLIVDPEWTSYEWSGCGCLEDGCNAAPATSTPLNMALAALASMLAVAAANNIF